MAVPDLVDPARLAAPRVRAGREPGLSRVLVAVPAADVPASGIRTRVFEFVIQHAFFVIFIGYSLLTVVFIAAFTMVGASTPGPDCAEYVQTRPGPAGPGTPGPDCADVVHTPSPR